MLNIVLLSGILISVNVNFSKIDLKKFQKCFASASLRFTTDKYQGVLTEGESSVQYSTVPPH
jgi:hypothetical protein